jgi:hypothetical protein
VPIARRYVTVADARTRPIQAGWLAMASRLGLGTANVPARDRQFGPSLEANSVSISRARLMTSSSS